MAPEASGAGFAGLAEIDERESVEIENSHLVWTRCRCGVRCAVAGDYVGRGGCVECRKEAAGVVDAKWAARRVVDPVVGHMFGGGTAPEAARVPFPAPLVTSRDPWDGMEGLPSPVAKLAERARAASWKVRVQRSGGCAPNAANGAPGAVKWRYAVRLASADAFDRQTHAAYAVYDADGEVWKSVMLWGSDRTWFPYASVTELGEYIDARGDVGEQWYAGVMGRLADGEARKRERAMCDRGEHVHAQRETRGPMFGWWCARCSHTWPLFGKAWRKMNSAKKEGRA